MKYFTFFSLLVVFVSFSSSSCDLNYRAVIGVLTRDIVYRTIPNKTSELEAAYVKSLEASGARIVPILIDQPKDYYQYVLTKINGVLFPGAFDATEYKGYVKAAKIVYDMIVKMNDEKDYFPLFGIDLGFELLSSFTSPKTMFKGCPARNLASTLNLSKGLGNSKMMRNLDDSLRKAMEEKPVAFHYHHNCLTEKNFTKAGLDKSFNIIALSKDWYNQTFISAVEGIKYPFYGIAFQPGAAQFNFVVSDYIENVPHSLEAIQVAQYFLNFFVDEARKNSHLFPNLEVEDNMLIYNYNPTFTGKYKSGFIIEQAYFF